MKALLMAVATLLMSTTSFAAIAVGTAVDYTETAFISGATTTGNLNYTVLAHNPLTDVYTVSASFDDGSGTVDTQQVDVEGARITMGATVLAGCVANYGGTLTKVTVAAGEFEVCYVKEVDAAQDYTAEYWVGDVPFNMVKTVETVGSDSVTTELKSVK